MLKKSPQGCLNVSNIIRVRLFDSVIPGRGVKGPNPRHPSCPVWRPAVWEAELFCTGRLTGASSGTGLSLPKLGAQQGPQSAVEHMRPSRQLVW